MAEKATDELWLAECFAEAHNRIHGSDFVARKADIQRDSADAFLFSESSGKRIALQICIASTWERMCEEGIQDKLQRKISKTLMDKGLSDCRVLVVPGHIPKKKDIQGWHDRVVRLVLENYEKAQPKCTIEDDIESTPDDDLHFSSIFITRGELTPQWKKWVMINFVIAKEIPEMQRIVQSVINLKVSKRYADSKKLWLLIQPGHGAFSTEIRELRESNFKGVESFAQVWWVYPQRGTATEILRLGTQGSPN